MSRRELGTKMVLLKKSIKVVLLLVIIGITAFLTVVQEYNIPLKYWFAPRGIVIHVVTRSHVAAADSKQKLNGHKAWQLIGPNQAQQAYSDLSSTLVSQDLPPGKLGRPVILRKHLKGSVRALVKMGWDDHVFNKFVSDIIPLNRSLLDVRDSWCTAKNRFLEDLPKASVVICFHNEALSTLLRTLHSVINRSPKNLLQEIILIDDYSYMTDLKRKLDEHLKTLPKVRIIRAKKREGIVRCRIIGAKEATAPVIVLLDSHCECTEGWLIPLLDRIARNYTNVASPVVDNIDDNTFQHLSQSSHELQIGGFTWGLNFIWRYVPARDILARRISAEPVKTPVISGGLFAISKRFFQEIGYYDKGLEIWGGDNFDISFKVWMCGGTLEVVPCSHVGHVFRKSFPYSVPSALYLRNNMARIAEVWLDDTAKYFYDRVGYTKMDVGNISAQKELRSKCKSFQWYLDNVYPDLELPSSYVAGGVMMNMAYKMKCLDTGPRINNVLENLQLLPCHYKGGNQYWDYTKDGQIKRDNFCLDVLSDHVVMSPCWDISLSEIVWIDQEQLVARAGQIWVHEVKTERIKHLATQKCLEAKHSKTSLIVTLGHCLPGFKNQQWVMERYNFSNASPELKRVMTFHST